jgi:hypothetical protein
VAASRVALLVLLVLSAAAALLGQPRVVVAVREGSLAAEWLWVAPLMFTLFVLIAAVDASIVARRRHSFRGRNMLQVAAAVAFVAFLLPQTAGEYRTRKAPAPTSPDMLDRLAKSRDARVRALVMELAGHRSPPPSVAALLERGMDDKDPMVRESALAAIARHAGSDTSEEQARELLRQWRIEASPTPATP